MRLHLHLGAHKTATTHFQNVLELNRPLYSNYAHYVSLDEFRKNVTTAIKFLNPVCCNEIDRYLDTLTKGDVQNLIISEENIIGEAKDIYRSRVLYYKLHKRINRLRDFIASFNDVTIWISIRSMDTFIPALYCESLLHFGYRGFGEVFSGKYEQSWIPVITTLKEMFPAVKINVIPYEEYGSFLPEWLAALTGIDSGWDLLEDHRPRERFNHMALKILKLGHWFIPQRNTPEIVEKSSNFFKKISRGSKFSPFNDDVTKSLQLRFGNDLEAIPGLGENVALISHEA